MDNTAIREIADLGLLQVDKKFAVIRKDQDLNSLERFEERPWQFRATYLTSLVDEFAKYLSLHLTQESTVFVDHQKGAAKAVLDTGTPAAPLWGKHVALLDLVPTPEYQALLEADGAGKLQMDFLDMVEDYRDCFQFLDGGQQPLDTQGTLVRLRTLKLGAKADKERSVGDYGQFASDIESLEITGAGNERLPAGFKYVFQPYEGFNTYTADCRMRAMTDGNAVRLKYRIVGLGSLKNDIAEELVTRLADKLAGQARSFHIGKFDYQ